MPEKKQTTTSIQHSLQGSEQNERFGVEASSAHRRGVEWFMLISGPAAAVTMGLYVLLYFQTGAWQLLVVAGGIALALSCLAPAYRLVRRGKPTAAGYWLVFGVTLAYSACELGWTGVTWYILGGGVLLIFVVGNTVLPRRWGVWAITAGLYGVYIWLVNLFEPLPRYAAMQSAVLRLYIPGITVFLALGAIWQLARSYQGLGTIRTRLFFAFGTIALLPASVVITASVVGGLSSGQEQVTNQLRSVATLKEAEIKTWVGSLQTDLNIALTGVYATQRTHLLLQGSPDTASFQEAHDELQVYYTQLTRGLRHFEELFLLDLKGRVLLSTNAERESKMYSQEIYFQQGLEGPYAQPPIYSIQLERLVVIATYPVITEQGQVLGVLAGQASMTALNEIMLERTGLSETGETYLVGTNHLLLTVVRSGEQGIYVRTQGANEAIERQAKDSGLYENYQGKPVVGVYHWLPNLQVALLAEEGRSQAFENIYAVLTFNVVIAISSVALAILAASFITRGIAGPLAGLAETANEIAAGDLQRVAQVDREDEIGILGQAFNAMTTQLRDLIGNLEERVVERTADLAARSAELQKAHQRQIEINRQLEETAQQSQRRATLLQASAEVSRAVAQIRELDQLLPQVTQLISQHFGFYHIGIFLIDEVGRYAVLRAANSKGGQRMLARQHKLGVGSEGIVGHVTGTGRPRIALDVGADAVYFDNPDMPDTRSELAVPLRIGERIIGALDVQSTAEAAFAKEDIAALTTMADQVAIAIQNARLFRQTQAALKDAQHAQQRYVQQEWSRLTQEQPHLAHEYTLSGVSPIGDTLLPESQEAWLKGDLVTTAYAVQAAGESDVDDGASARAVLAAPIKVRGEIIGVLDLQETDVERLWTEDDIALVQAVADQLGQALESARLFEQTQTSLAETQTLFETSRSLAAAQETEDIWQAIINAARQRHADACVLLLFDTLERENAHALVLAAGWEQHDPARLPIGTHLPLGDFDTLRPDQNFCITDLAQADRVNKGTRQLMTSLGFSALLHQPIAVRGRWFGMLTVLHQSPHTFTQSEMDFYRSLADQAALAFESQRLLAETQHRAEREQLIRQITDKVRATSNLETILQTTVQEMSKAMGLPRVFVRLGLEQDLIQPEQK